MLAYALGIIVGFLITLVVIYYSYPNVDFPCNCRDPKVELDLVNKALEGDKQAQKMLESSIVAPRPVVPIERLFIRFVMIAIFLGTIGGVAYIILNRYNRSLLVKLNVAAPQ